MSTAQLAIPVILAPLHDLWRWLMPASADRSKRDIAMHSIAGSVSCAKASTRNSSKNLVSRPLRIVRVMEAGQAPAHVGRMVISGRMADVCAELDRLAAREAALH